MRRELARISVEKLIEDGRIHPARIEDVTSKVRSEFEQNIQEDGEAAAFELALPHVHPKLIRLIGTLKYHGRVGQNLLDHSMEVAFLGQVLALELKADSEIVKRAA
ncbi:MAG: ribonuclease Y, partial [Acidobacteriota bacterium]